MGLATYLALWRFRSTAQFNLLDEHLSEILEKDAQEDASGSLAAQLSAWLSESEYGRRFTQLVREAELGYSPGRILVYAIFLAVILSIIGQILDAGLIITLLLSSMGFIIPYLWLQQQIERKAFLILEQLPEAILVITNALGAGASIQQAFDASVEELPNPIAREFKQVSAEMKVGRGLAEALEHFRQRVNLTALDSIIAAILIQKRSGGNLPELLNEIAALLKEDVELQQEMIVQTSQAKLSARIVGVAPIVVFIFMIIAAPDYMAPMTSSPIGIAMLVGAFLLEALGFYVVQRIGVIET